MATNKSNWAQKAKVKLKILVPMGVTLTPSETIVLSDMYKEDVKVLEKNSAEIRKAISATENKLNLSETIATARAVRNQATGIFKITKDPIKRREWARRIVIADQTIQSMRDVKTRLATTKDRLVMIKGDMELQLMEAEAKSGEMDAYASAGNSLRLAGEKLIQARTRANKLNLEYSNLEVTMEGAEKMMSSLYPESLLAKAKEIIGRGNNEGVENERS